MKSLLTTADLSSTKLNEIFTLAAQGKSSAWREYSSTLAGKVLGLLFFDPSLRTRASLQSGIARLGGSSVALNSGTDTWKLEFGKAVVMDKDKSEHVIEAAGVLSSYFDLLGVRAFPAMQSFEEDKQEIVLRNFIQHSKVPVLNLESSLWHPCQALADGFTLRELFASKISKKTFVLSWANHPKQLPTAVPNSALLMAAQVGCNVRLVCPEGYELDQSIIDLAKNKCAEHGTKFQIMHNQREAFQAAHVIYAKSWAPPCYIGQPTEDLERRKSLKHWMVTGELMSGTDDGVFMHCLPVRRNVVVADEVLDSLCSIVQQQAANRLHAQNALLVDLFGKN